MIEFGSLLRNETGEIAPWVNLGLDPKDPWKARWSSGQSVLPMLLLPWRDWRWRQRNPQKLKDQLAWNEHLQTKACVSNKVDGEDCHPCTDAMA